MVEMISYTIVAIYLIVADRYIASRVKRATGHGSMKKGLIFYRACILSTIAIFTILSLLVYFRFITVR